MTPPPDTRKIGVLLARLLHPYGRWRGMAVGLNLVIGVARRVPSTV